ncbi:hypothetical protein GCM10027062_26160 [Nocardioides hungaricus]
MTRHLLEDLLDEIEDIQYAAEPGVAARQLEEAARSMGPGELGRAAFLVAAAESWTAIAELDAALRCAEDAVSDGGPTSLGSHAAVIEVLLAREEHDLALARAKELRALLAAGQASDTEPDYVAEAFEEAGLLKEAHRWFSLAVAHVDPGEVEARLGGVLTTLIGRRRVRERLGLPPDRLDQAGERARQRTLAHLGIGGRGGARTAGPAGTTALIHWPAGEWERFVDLWPDLAEGYGSDLPGHRRATEQRLRELAGNGVSVSVALGAVDEYAEFAVDQELDPAASASRARYAAEVARTGRATRWPPGRNDRCWCGSGQKYKRCCGAAG